MAGILPSVGPPCLRRPEDCRSSPERLDLLPLRLAGEPLPDNPVDIERGLHLRRVQLLPAEMAQLAAFRCIHDADGEIQRRGAP